MRRMWMALGAVVALSVGIVLAEGKDSHANKNSAACCCSGQSCGK